MLHHLQSALDQVPLQSELVPINLSELELGPLQDNQLGESRAFLRDFSDVTEEYVGFVNARFDQKYFQLHTRLHTLVPTVRRFAAPGWVLAPWPGDNWIEVTNTYHPSMLPLVGELLALQGLPRAGNRTSVWANDFVCHRSVFFDWLRFWRSSFDHFYAKYGLQLPFAGEGTDRNRQTAYFLERITAAYFANRPDVRVVGLE